MTDPATTNLTATLQAPSGDAVEQVDIWTCRFDLPRPLVLPDFTLREREYVIVRITTRNGTTGVSYALTRGLPIEAVIRSQVAPLIIGHDPFELSSLQRLLDGRLTLIRFEGILQRAISLINIALWDANARAVGLPLWKLLGGAPASKQILLVDAYQRDGETEDDLLERLRERAHEGYRALKLHAPGETSSAIPFPARVRTAAGDSVELIVDASMEFQSPREAAISIEKWADARLAWVEDPFHADRVEWLAQLRSMTRVPIGAGDEVASAQAMRRLATRRAVDLVRLDATIHGGISGALELAKHAVAEGIGVSFHVYPEIHHHLAACVHEVEYVEAFTPETEYDAADRFIASEAMATRADGAIAPSHRPGLGLEIDWEALESGRVRAP